MGTYCVQQKVSVSILLSAVLPLKLESNAAWEIATTISATERNARTEEVEHLCGKPSSFSTNGAFVQFQRRGGR